MRRVVDWRTVIHYWANQVQDGARSPTGHCSFEGPTLYSYRATIARLHPEAGVVLFNSAYAGYSVTTSKHYGQARSSYSKTTYPHTFTVPNINPTYEGGHVENLRFFVQMHTYALQCAARPRIRQATRLANEAEARHQLATAMDYCKAFRVPKYVWSKYLDEKKLAAALSQAVADAAERATQMAARDAERVRQAEYLRVKGLTPEQALAEWREGKIGSFGDHYDMRLRIRNDIVETSRGASIPVEHAKRVWPILLRAKRNGTHITAEQGGGLHFGVYQSFHEFNAEGSGNLVVGCHTIPWAEIEYIAQQLGLTQEVAV
jgi:hypothetical protein